MNNVAVSLIVLLICCVAYLLFRIWKLRGIVDHYKYEDEWAWPQHELSGDWREYKGKMSLSLYIKCLMHESATLGKILTNKIDYHVGHPFNERNLVLRSVIRDLKLLYNHLYESTKFGGLEDEAKYVHTFWSKPERGK